MRRLCSGEAAIPLRQHGPSAEVQGSPRLPSLEQEVRYGPRSNHHVPEPTATPPQRKNHGHV